MRVQILAVAAILLAGTASGITPPVVPCRDGDSTAAYAELVCAPWSRFASGHMWDYAEGPDLVVLNDADAWRAYCERVLRPYSGCVAPVDFEREFALVLVGLSCVSTSSYAEILSITHVPDSDAYPVLYVVTPPFVCLSGGGFGSQWFDAVRVERLGDGHPTAEPGEPIW